MKSLKLILLLLLSPIYFFAQQQLSGLWIGTMSNDSNTVRKDQSFEIIIAEYKGKVSGYSRSTFLVNDTLYHIVKRVKGTIVGDVCEVKDDEIVSHNFPKKPEKGVKVISTFRRNKMDSSWYLEGDWKTTQTKKYYTVSGKVDLKEEKDYTQSKLFPHLEELRLDKNIPFYQESKKQKEMLAKSNTTSQPLAGSNGTGAANTKSRTTPAATNASNSQPIAKNVEKQGGNNPQESIAKQTLPSSTAGANNNSPIANANGKPGNPDQSIAKTAFPSTATTAGNTTPKVYGEKTAGDTPQESMAKSNPPSTAGTIDPAATKPGNASTNTTAKSTTPNPNISEQKHTGATPGQRDMASVERPSTTSTSIPVAVEKKTPAATKNGDNSVAANKQTGTNTTLGSNQPVNASAATTNDNRKTGEPIAAVKSEAKPGNSPVNNNPVQVASSKPVSAPPAFATEDKKAGSVATNTGATGSNTTPSSTPPDKTSSSVAIIPAPVKPVVNPAGAAKFVAERKIETTQVVSFISDSLVLALYDNGEIDGDTVSVLLNGEVFIPKQVLKASAFKKTIYITPGNEELTLVLYAENLGSYPPNTGLLIVYDGEERHQIRFSADFDKNAAVVFRRKK